MSESNTLAVIRPSSLSELKELASTLSGARTIPDALQKSPADIMALVMTGAELGLAPMQSLRGLVLIKGKPTLSADAMGALVKSRRDVCQYLLLRHSDAQRATYEARRVGDPEATTLTFTMEEAQRAGLASNDNWRKFPAAMLRARALSAICRAVFPDLILGVYDPDELAEAPAPIRESRGGMKADSGMGPPSVIDAVVSVAPPTPPAPPEVDPLTREVQALQAAIEAAQDMAALNALTPRLRALPGPDRARMRALYEPRFKALGGGK